MILKVVSCILAVCFSTCFAANNVDKYTIKVGSYSKDYQIVAPQGVSDVKIVYMADINDNYELNTNAADELAKKIVDAGLLQQADAIVMPGDKANMMGTLLIRKLKEIKPSLEFVIIRANDKGGSVKSVNYSSITNKDPKKLHLRQDQQDRIQGKKVILFDDVISTGGTMKAVAKMMQEISSEVVAYVTLGTEGEDLKAFENKPLIKLIHVPVFKAVK